MVYVTHDAKAYSEAGDRLMFIDYKLMAQHVKSQIGEDMDCIPQSSHNNLK